MIQSLFLTLAQAAPSTPSAPPQNPLGGIMMILPMIVIFYFLILRPQQKRQKDLAKLISSVKTGDSVVMNSGIHGIVTNVKETTVLVKVADNVKIEFDKAAVASISKASSEG